MPSKHRRIAVVEDPELSEALTAAGEDLPHRSRASLLRQLAIIGSRQVTGESSPTALDRLLSMPGAEAPRSGAGGIRSFLDRHPLEPSPDDDRDALSRALAEQREDRA